MSIELEPAEVRRAAKAVILGALLGSLLAVLARSPVRGRVRAADD
jgi:hypothetical protein